MFVKLYTQPAPAQLFRYRGGRPATHERIQNHAMARRQEAYDSGCQLLGEFRLVAIITAHRLDLPYTA